MTTKIIESEGDAGFSRGEVAIVTRLDNAIRVLEQKQDEFADYLKELKERSDEVDRLKKLLLETMDKNKVTKLENDRLKITAVHPSAKKTINLRELQAKNPRVYQQAFDIAGKETQVSGYVKITVKER